MPENGYETALKALMEAALEAVKRETKEERDIPIGISNRHIHLSQVDLEVLFGFGYELTPIKDLSQPGQFACEETLILCGPKGSIENVRVLGPVRNKTQVEILSGDGFKLGIKAPVRLSGDLEGTPGITIVGPKGSIRTEEGVIAAKRHIHMTAKEAGMYGVENGQIVKIKMEGQRGGVYDNVEVRVSEASALECHLDVEEANAMALGSSMAVKIIK